MTDRVFIIINTETLDAGDLATIPLGVPASLPSCYSLRVQLSDREAFDKAYRFLSSANLPSLALALDSPYDLPSYTGFSSSGSMPFSGGVSSSSVSPSGITPSGSVSSGGIPSSGFPSSGIPSSGFPSSGIPSNDDLPSAYGFRGLASVFFLPNYLYIEGRPVILLPDASPEATARLSESLGAYLSPQGIHSPIFYRLVTPDLLHWGPVPEGTEPIPDLSRPSHPMFRSVDDLAAHYSRQLSGFERGVPGSLDMPLFFEGRQGRGFENVLQALERTEKDFALQHPGLYEQLRILRLLEKELNSVRNRLAATETELTNQQKYLDILRSDHPTRELQDYYHKEYEILPRWYKRFGHLLKVLTGKRTFQSLYRDDVKKYK
jgi:hypothetical protein